MVVKLAIVIVIRFYSDYSFLILEFQKSQYIKVRKLFKGGNYSREETIQGWKLYEEMQYADFYAKNFLILYPWSWNSITSNAILHT